MSNILKTIPWLLLGIATVALVAITSSQGVTQSQLLEIVRNPLAVAVAVSLFAYLIIGRLKDMESRITRVEDRSIAFWQDALKEIQSVSAAQAKSTIDDMQNALDQKVSRMVDKVDETINDNQWLKDITPDELVLSVKHLEPILDKARELVKNKSKKELARNWLTELIDDPEVDGAPNDYHNVGVFVSTELNDDLLALKIYRRYLATADQPNLDLMADALQIATTIERWGEARQVAEDLEKLLHSGDFRYTNKWRPWVFLSDYYLAIGQADEAVSLLREASEKVISQDEQAHVFRNLAATLTQIGKVDEALRIHEKVSQEFPTHVPNAIQFARLLLRIGERDRAKVFCEDYLSRGNFDPAFDRSYERLMLLHKKVFKDNNVEEDEFSQGINVALSVASDIFGDDEARELLNGIRSRLSSGDERQDDAQQVAAGDV